MYDLRKQRTDTKQTKRCYSAANDLATVRLFSLAVWLMSSFGRVNAGDSIKGVGTRGVCSFRLRFASHFLYFSLSISLSMLSISIAMLGWCFCQCIYWGFPSFFLLICLIGSNQKKEEEGNCGSEKWANTRLWQILYKLIVILFSLFYWLLSSCRIHALFKEKRGKWEMEDTQKKQQQQQAICLFWVVLELGWRWVFWGESLVGKKRQSTRLGG